MSEIESSIPQARGPADHNVRDQIVVAAEAHFSHYGYEKTTVSDLAKAIGFSKAYIYKFFDSKQAIGEAICARTLSTIVAAVEEAVAGATRTSGVWVRGSIEEVASLHAARAKGSRPTTARKGILRC